VRKSLNQIFFAFSPLPTVPSVSNCRDDIVSTNRVSLTWIIRVFTRSAKRTLRRAKCQPESTTTTRLSFSEEQSPCEHQMSDIVRSTYLCKQYSVSHPDVLPNSAALLFEDFGQNDSARQGRIISATPLSIAQYVILRKLSSSRPPEIGENQSVRGLVFRFSIRIRHFTPSSLLLASSYSTLPEISFNDRDTCRI